MNRPLYCLTALAVSLSTFACTAQSSGNQVAGNPAGVSGGAGSGNGADGGIAEGKKPGSSCPINNLTRQCTCDNDGEAVAGRQVCRVSTGWGPCECAKIPSTIQTLAGAADPAANKGSESFDWERTMPAAGSCEAGHYEGTFDGTYSPTVFFGFSSSSVDGNVGFDLTASTNGEFFEVSGGYMKGVALDIYPFEGEVVGKLDCTSRYFDGYLKNCSYVFWGLTTPFEGPLLANYDIINHSFVNGQWSVTEPDATGAYPPVQPICPGNPLPPPPVAGGVGNWTATYR